MKLTGKILWISQRDGNGVIVTEDKKEWYFDSSVAKNFKMISRIENNIVTFEHNEKITDCRCAKNVELV